MGTKVLIVDDQADIVETLTSILKIQGFSVEQSFNGEECLNKSKGKEIIFLDIMMPGMSGEDVAKELRNRYKNNVKIVYLTIKPKLEVDLKNVDAFIQKPFSLSQVVSTAKKIEMQGGV